MSSEHHQLSSIPHVVQGGISTDDRGSLTFLNGFSLNEYKRFYTVKNHSQGFVRAWHGHVVESKVFYVLQGSILACAVKMTDTKNPDKTEKVTRVVLSANSPSAFFIPNGYANGFMSLTTDSHLIVFSNTSLEESQGDDYRFPYDYWNPWEIVPR